jgi:hypothetical protein
MSKKPVTTVALVGLDVPTQLAIVNEKLKSLKHITDSVYRTTGNLEGFGDLKSEAKMENLIRAFSMVSSKEEAYHKSASSLGLNHYPAFSISGGNTADWEHDIKLRINVITHKDVLDKLNGFKTE